MKKFFTTLFTLAALTVQAQYIPNGSFDSWKGSGNAGSTYQSSSGDNRKRPGDEPASWNGSSINQKVSGVTKEETLITKSTGRNGSAVKMQNKWVGATIVFVKVGDEAPGFINFGTPWVYAVSNTSNCDGGVYGGISFQHRPDAIKGWYKRTGGTGEKAHIIAYLWKGTFKNNIKSEKDNDTRSDTDRAVMGRVSSTGDGVRIASCDYTFATTTNNDWQEIVVPLNYENDYIPEKLNIIISSGDYWTRDNVKDGSVLEADDIEFLYYSELASLTYNGKNYFQASSNKISSFRIKDIYSHIQRTILASRTSYTIDEFYDESKLSVTSNGKGAVIEKSFDSSNNVLTITIKGNDFATNSSNFHTYTVAFKTEEPLTVVSVNPSEAVESLKTITVEYSDEIAGTYSASATSKISVGGNNASFSVSGKVLTITLDKAITTPGNYALTIPSDIVTRKSNGKPVTCDGEINFTVKAPVLPLEVVAYTPNEPVEALKTITVEYSDEIAGTYSASAATKIYVGSSSNTASFSVSGKVLTITLDKAITTPGEYALTIPSGLVARKVNGAAVTCSGEIKFTVKETPVDTPLKVLAFTPSSAVESLKTITIEYNDELAGTYNASAASKIYVGSSSNTALFSVSGNVLTITLDKTITTPGEYALTIPVGLVTRKVNGEAVTCSGDIKFTVKAAPLAVVAVNPNKTVESLEKIIVEYSDEIVGTYSASAASKIYVGSSTASFSVSGKVLTITLDDAITTTGEYALTIPAGLVTRKVNGEAVTCNGEIKFTVKSNVDYTPSYTGVKSKTVRYISTVTMSSTRYPNAASNTFTVDNSGNPCYSDYSASVLMKAAPGETVTLAINADDATSWMNAYAYIDADNNGFTASIESGSNWLPAGDLVSYSFYNNNDPYDTNGWNSAGAVISGNSRSTVQMPAFAVPAKAGVYRVRVKLDWCNIDPNGDSDGKFGDFMDNGGQIVDFLLNVTGDPVVEPEPTPGEDVDYTPTNTGTRNYTERNINSFKFVSRQYGAVEHNLTAEERNMEYLDLTASVEVLVAPGEVVDAFVLTEGSWVNHYIYVDADYNGFAASIESGSNWRPAGDLVSYSFYNNGGSSDTSGWNSEGQMISGDDRSYPVIPSFVAPAKNGRYRMRIKQDWCSIDPAGDSDSNFGGTFSNYGGQIIDVVLRVSDPTGIGNIEAESSAKVIYDMHGRRLDEITKPGIYIVNGKKIYVK